MCMFTCMYRVCMYAYMYGSHPPLPRTASSSKSSRETIEVRSSLLSCSLRRMFCRLPHCFNSLIKSSLPTIPTYIYTCIESQLPNTSLYVCMYVCMYICMYACMLPIALLPSFLLLGRNDSKFQFLLRVST